jgi:hypothetical protein
VGSQQDTGGLPYIVFTFAQDMDITKQPFSFNLTAFRGAVPLTIESEGWLDNRRFYIEVDDTYPMADCIASYIGSGGHFVTLGGYDYLAFGPIACPA